MPAILATRPVLTLAMSMLSQSCVAYNVAPTAGRLERSGASVHAGAVSRRWTVQAAAATAAAALAGIDRAKAAQAEASRLGGLLEPYTDVKKGFKLYKPSGWNQFDTDPGVFDVKFQDIIEPFETVQVSTSPVTTATSVDALGSLQEVGAKFAKSRNADLIGATERTVKETGSLVYTLELKGEVYHELLVLSINRGKLYRVTCVASNKRWSKRKDIYENVVLSFVPQGF